MIAVQLAEAVATARTLAAVDNLSRLLYRGLAEGHVSETDAEAIELALQVRRLRLKGQAALSQPKTTTAPRRSVSPDRVKSRERRRRLAMSGAVPGAIASSFTMGELAVLSVVAREVQRRGRCELPLGQIAAIAGVGRTVAQGALRAARRLGLLTVEERRRAGQRSDTNVVQLVSREWASWLSLGGGFRKPNTTNTDSKKGANLVLNTPAREAEPPLMRSASVRVILKHNSNATAILTNAGSGSRRT